MDESRTKQAENLSFPELFFLTPVEHRQVEISFTTPDLSPKGVDNLNLPSGVDFSKKIDPGLCLRKVAKFTFQTFSSTEEQQPKQKEYNSVGRDPGESLERIKKKNLYGEKIPDNYKNQ